MSFRFLIPFYQSYARSGEFTRAKRVRFALLDNLIDYSVAVIAFSVFAIYLVATKTFKLAALFGLVMALANAFGLLLVIFFLGFGLVDVPRRCWYRAHRARQLRRHQFYACDVNEDRAVARYELDNVLLVRLQCSMSLSGFSNAILERLNDPFFLAFLGSGRHQSQTASRRSVTQHATLLARDS